MPLDRDRTFRFRRREFAVLRCASTKMPWKSNVNLNAIKRRAKRKPKMPRREKAERSRYGQFLEAWHLLGADGTGLTIHASVENDVLLALLKAKVAEECSR